FLLKVPASTARPRRPSVMNDYRSSSLRFDNVLARRWALASSLVLLAACSSSPGGEQAADPSATGGSAGSAGTGGGAGAGGGGASGAGGGSDVDSGGGGGSAGGDDGGVPDPGTPTACDPGAKVGDPGGSTSEHTAGGLHFVVRVPSSYQPTVGSPLIIVY